MLSKDINYFNNTRNELAGLVKEGNNKVLDIGCGAGNMGVALKKENKAIEVFGIELVPEIAKIAEEKLDKVICGDIEGLDLQFPQGYFDYIIAGDVLEHLRNPSGTLRKISFYLREGGCIVASIPNVRHWRVIADLVLKGEWKYQKAGILDDTHLRFFTKKTVFEMVKNSGFKEIKITPIFKFGKACRKVNLINNLSLGLLEEFLTGQYVVIAKKYELS